MKVVRALISIVAVITLAITLLASGFAVCALFPQTTQMLAEANSGTSWDSPFEQEDLVDAAVATRDYTVGSHDEEALLETLHSINDHANTPLAGVSDDELLNGEETYTLTADALSHLDDVYDVVVAAYIILAIIAAVALVCCILVGVLGHKRLLGIVLLIAGLVILIACAVVAIWAVADFNGFFAAFHTLFFAAGSWTFSATSLLITMYPTEFWIGMGIVWIAVSAVLVLASIIVGIILIVRGRHAKQVETSQATGQERATA